MGMSIRATIMHRRGSRQCPNRACFRRESRALCINDWSFFLGRFVLYLCFHLCNADAIAPTLFCPVHGAVSTLDQGFARLTVQLIDRYTDTGGNRYRYDRLAVFGFPEVWQLGNCRPQTFGNHSCSAQVGIGQNNGKFFTSIAPDEFFQAQGAAEARSDFMQDCVARAMPPGIIDTLEMVYVCEQDGAGPAASTAMHQFFIDPAHDRAVVGQSRDGIGYGGLCLLPIKTIHFRQQFLQLVVGLLQVRTQGHFAVVHAALFAQQGT